MITLQGSPVSNYYRMVLIALIEKGFDFEEILTGPNQNPEYLSLSPMGKIPCIQVREGSLCESAAILEFLEDIQRDITLMPGGPYEKAKCRELMRMAELYIDLPARRVVLPRLMKQQVPDSDVAKAAQEVSRGFAAVARLTDFSNYLLGDQFSYADIVLYCSLALSDPLEGMLKDWSPAADTPGMADWRQRVSERHAVRAADEACQKAMPAFLAQFEDS